jgi:branched-chain amino acid transport system ATP-binding protein
MTESTNVSNGASPDEPRAAGTGSVLQVEQVSAAYGPYRALFGVSFSIPEGAVVALLGSNGAGKSTVARVITGLVPTTAGHIRLDGREVTGRPAWRIARAGVAHVPEGRGVLAGLTVEENLTLVFRQRAGRSRVAASLAKAYDVFPVLGDRRRQAAGTLSGGQQRILSLAKVLVVPPRLLVADELSLGLAPIVIDTVYDSLREINRVGTAILAVEQQVDRVLGLARSAVVLEHGRVAYEGAPDGARQAVEGIVASRAERVDAGARRVDWSDAADSGRP